MLCLEQIAGPVIVIQASETERPLLKKKEQDDANDQLRTQCVALGKKVPSV